MTLEQLRVFVAVAERQHVTRAAEALKLAQSAVSAAVAALEARHGAKLFHRVGRGIELTEAGSVFLVEARAVLARAEAAELVLSELGGLKRGTLTLQASQTIASYWLPHHLVAFRRAHPGIDIHLTVGNTAQVAAAVRLGEAELGFVEGAVDDPMLVARVVAKDQLVRFRRRWRPRAWRSGCCTVCISLCPSATSWPFSTPSATAARQPQPSCSS
jgi:DNA-binding transcriptional LysR family regulator